MMFFRALAWAFPCTLFAYFGEAFSEIGKATHDNNLRALGGLILVIGLVLGALAVMDMGYSMFFLIVLVLVTFICHMVGVPLVLLVLAWVLIIFATPIRLGLLHLKSIQDQRKAARKAAKEAEEDIDNQATI